MSAITPTTSIAPATSAKALLKEFKTAMKAPQKELIKANTELAKIAKEIVDINKDNNLFFKIGLAVVGALAALTVVGLFLTEKCVKSWQTLNKQDKANKIGQARVSLTLEAAAKVAAEKVREAEKALADIENSLFVTVKAPVAPVAAKPVYAWYNPAGFFA